MSEKKEEIKEKGGKLKLACYDFDCTISVTHIYHALRKANGSKWFVRCIKQDNGDASTAQLETLVAMDKKKVLEWFGGEKRIKLVDAHFAKLTKGGCQLRIISYGFSAVIKKALDIVGLGKYFAQATIFGADTALMKKFNQSKATLIDHWMESSKPKLTLNEVVFVDDDKSNVAEAEALPLDVSQPSLPEKEDLDSPPCLQNVKAKTVCRTVHVAMRRGMTAEHFKTIEAYM